MLNAAIQQKILGVLSGYVLSTSMVARKTRLSRITVSKYLSALQTKHVVQAVRIGKAVAWRVIDHKPLVGILASTSTARMIKLGLGEKYSYLVGTSAASMRDAFVLITDNAQYVKTASVPVILLGASDDDAYTLPTFFDTRTLKVLVKKLLHEQIAPSVEASAAIVIEHFEQFEEALGVHRADELLKLTARLLKENRVSVRQFERNTFLIIDDVPEPVLVDIEQTFHLIVAHVYGRMVSPGESVTIHGSTHTVPALTITLASPVAGEIDDMRHTA
jgi:hypothetical protein